MLRNGLLSGRSGSALPRHLRLLLHESDGNSIYDSVVASALLAGRAAILVFSEILGDLGDGRDVMDLVDVSGHAARTEIADAGGVQFQGSNSSSRWAG
jgi:hypothetical protein